MKIIDYSDYFCRSWQYLYFEPRVVYYIRIVGTNNTVNKVIYNYINNLKLNFFVNVKKILFLGVSCSKL